VVLALEDIDLVQGTYCTCAIFYLQLPAQFVLQSDCHCIPPLHSRSGMCEFASLDCVDSLSDTCAGVCWHIDLERSCAVEGLADAVGISLWFVQQIDAL
jgi:hypothetical protein